MRRQARVAGLGARERIALFVCLPLLALVSIVTWQLWTRVQGLDDALADSRQSESDLIAQVRDAVGREHLAGRALQQALDERDAARAISQEAQDRAADARRDAERQAALAERLRQQRRAELDRMAAALGHIAPTDRTPMGMVVQLGEDSFLFEFDRWDLTPPNREILSRIAGVLLASYGYRVYVDGHTDRRGGGDYNQRLSERRALAVRSYLEGAGIPADLIQTRGFGESFPSVPGDSPGARRQNRRVEIGIVDTVIEYGAQVIGPAGSADSR